MVETIEECLKASTMVEEIEDYIKTNEQKLVNNKKDTKIMNKDDDDEETTEKDEIEEDKKDEEGTEK